MIICQKCGVENINGAVFCADCGSMIDSSAPQIKPQEEQDTYCPMCGVLNKKEINSCSNCDSSLLTPMNHTESVYQQPVTIYPPSGIPQQPYVSPYPSDINFEGQKSKVVAGLLGIFLGIFGAGRFYLGYTGIGVAQLIVSLVTFGAGAIWGLIDGIIILTGGVKTDSRNIPLK